MENPVQHTKHRAFAILDPDEMMLGAGESFVFGYGCGGSGGDVRG